MNNVTLGNPSDGKSFLPTPGRKLSDKMIDGPFAVGDEVVFTLPDDIVVKSGTFTFAMTIYGGAVFELEFYLE